MKNAFLIGEQVYLRPYERADAEVLMGYLNDPEVSRTLVRHRPLNLIREQEFLDGLYKDDSGLVLGIVVRQDDRIIGGTGLHDIHPVSREAGFGIFIGAKEEWDKGHGTEATALMVRHGFQTLSLNRIWLRAFADNDRAIKVYERVGFRKEGVFRQSRYREGRYVDEIAMAILRQEWEQKQKAGR